MLIFFSKACQKFQGICGEFILGVLQSSGTRTGDPGIFVHLPWCTGVNNSPGQRTVGRSIVFFYCQILFSALIDTVSWASETQLDK